MARLAHQRRLSSGQFRLELGHDSQRARKRAEVARRRAPGGDTACQSFHVAALAKRPGLYRPVKRHATMRLDADVIEWFKQRPQGRGYQSEINRVLRKVAGLG